MDAAPNGIRVGTSGFSFDDWVGPVYPKGTPKPRMLEFYETSLGFECVELNYTYYAMPVPRTMEQLVAKTGEGFEFVVRSHKDMTHDIWTDDRRTTLRDTEPVFRAFRQGISPLVDSGRFGCLLVQLPSFFWPNQANAGYLRRMPELIPDVPLVVEFRNRAWLKDETFDLLRDANLGYCVVDEPDLPRLVPFRPDRTSDIAYFRFHGRNRNWFNASRAERYDYLYSDDELRGFLDPVHEVSGAARRSYLFFNNCHAGSAARNALLVKQMLGLVEELTPQQQRIVSGEAARSGEQGTLFA